MYELESMPILIESHRTYLRSLFEPRAMPNQMPSLRERLGARIVRFGQWVANHCPEIAPEPASGSRPGLSRT